MRVPIRRAADWLRLIFVIIVTVLGVSHHFAYGQKQVGGLSFPSLPPIDASSQLSSQAATPELRYEAHFTWDADRNQGVLHVSAIPGEGSHTYSMRQSKGPLPTRIQVRDKNVELLGPWTADHEPMIGFDDVAFPGIPLEEYHSKVTWSAPFRFTGPVDPADAAIALRVNGLVCSVACKPVGADLTAKLHSSAAGETGDQPLTTPGAVTVPDQLPGRGFRVERTHASWKAAIIPGQAAPGETVHVIVDCEPDPGYHIWRFVPHDDEPTYRTLIVATRKSGLKFGAPQTDAPLATYESLPGMPQYYSSPVRFTIPVLVPNDMRPGEYEIELRVGFGTCDDRSCDPPAGLVATGVIEVVDHPAGRSVKPMELSATSFRDVAAIETLTNWIDLTGDGSSTAGDTGDAGDVATEVRSDTQATSPQPSGGSGEVADSIAQSSPSVVQQAKSKTSDANQAAGVGLRWWHLLAALAGGFILNFMPCVLPVIGLKIMSFVDQAGSDRSKVISLNLAFVGGILVVFLALAAVTVWAKIVLNETFGWGQQFTVLEFKVALAALVFAMALSFLGVWEIPIPGFAVGSTSNELMQKEGLVGAFLKGVLTTVLATPCSGPLLGSLFGLSLTLSPLGIVVLYALVGLGMSLPYLLLCLTPDAVNYLPKPGAWMDTLKQVLAFPLLFTVVFFVASIENDHRIATLTFLIFVWMACWLVGRTPAYAGGAARLKAWSAALAVMVLGAMGSFRYLGPSEHDLEWIPYSEERLVQLRQEGKTVMIDFTANWCVNCQINMQFAIDRESVAELVDQYDVVTMVADWTTQDERIGKKLAELGSNSIPVLAIYPPDPNADPIVLRDLLTESQVIEALKQAGPSRGAESWFTSRID